ncbi:MAG TPA: LuxR C-terminal-related transcriptional regulator [Solirubrobacterales bacterium]|nr:LuxR C-terminal-related transcriptional regulator [Solirubrobacterales bacterium]
MSPRFPAPRPKGQGAGVGTAAPHIEADSAPVLIVDADQRCVEANASASRLLGRDRSELVGQSLSSLDLPEGHLLVLPRIEDAGDAGGSADPADAGDGRTRRPSKREREVLALLAQGSTDAQIAEVLDLSPATVQTHVRNAKAKLGARTRAQAVALALVSGLIQA